MSDIGEEVELEIIDDSQERARFEEATRKHLRMSGAEFEAKLDADDIDDLDQSAAMRVAILRPVETSNT